MKKLLLLAAFLVPVAAFAHEGTIEQSPEPTAAAEQATASNPMHEEAGTTVTNPLHESSDKPAPTQRPVATPEDCDDGNDANCDKAAPTVKPSPRPCTDSDSDCDDVERQTPKRDFGDRMKAGLHSVGSFFSKIAQWGHTMAKTIIQNLRG